jgi:hypothetical protein
MGVVINGTIAEQPVAASDRIGIEVVDPAFVTGSVGGRPCPSGRRCRLSDALGVLVDEGVNVDVGFVNRSLGPPTLFTQNSLQIDLNTPTFGPFDFIFPYGLTPTVGQQAHKVGAQSAWTAGPVTATCVDVNLSLFGTDSGITILCADRVNLRADPGDSGSPVFTFSGGVTGGPIILGVLFAGSQQGPGNWTVFYSNYQHVVSELGSVGWLSVIP